MEEDSMATQVTVTFLEEDKTQADRVKNGHDAGTEDIAATVKARLRLHAVRRVLECT